MKHDFAAGASASLNKTITAIERFLEDKGNRPPSGLRAYMFDRQADLAVKWYRRGFKRGHEETAKQCKKGRVPRVLRYHATREFFIDNERTIRLKSTLKKKRHKSD